MKKTALLLRSSLLIGLGCVHSVHAQNLTLNDGFEGSPQQGVPPPGWSNCNDGHSSVDTQPGFFGNNVAPSQGQSYISLVTRQLNPAATVETVWTPLMLQQFHTFTFSIDLSLSQNFHGNFNWTDYYFNAPCVLQIIGFNGSCAAPQDQELLWQSDPLTNFAWQTFNVSFSPTVATLSKLAIRPFFTPSDNYQNGAVLVDNLVYAPPSVEGEGEGQVEAEVPNTIFIPNVFTPNGDTCNEWFRIDGTNIVELNASIFDRWGNLVHILSDPHDAWKGRDDYGDCAAGTYFVTAHVVFRNGETITKSGTITLLR